MGKFYDLIKGASHHAWDGLAVRKLAKAMDEVWNIDELYEGDVTFRTIKDEWGLSSDELIKNIKDGKPICYGDYTLPRTTLYLGNCNMTATYGFSNADCGASAYFDINLGDQEISFTFYEV